MKRMLMLATILLAASSLFGQNRITLTNETTSALPEGAYVDKGKILVRRGFNLNYSSDKVVVSVIKMREKGLPGETTGSFSCSCTGEGACSVRIAATGLYCVSTQDTPCSNSCILIVTMDPKGANVATRNAVKWKKWKMAVAAQ